MKQRDYFNKTITNIIIFYFNFIIHPMISTNIEYQQKKDLDPCFSS